MSDVEKIRQKLIEDNWKPGSNSKPPSTFIKASTWYKLLPGLPCRTNERNGIQVCVTEYYITSDGRYSYELDIVAESWQEVWVDFKFYAMEPEKFLNNFDSLVHRLIHAWETANGDC